MVDPVTARTWLHRALYVGLILLIALGQLLPLGPATGRLPGPDLIVALTFAWVLRRPAYVPLPLVAVTFLFLDMLLQHPPGLGAALMVIGSEVLRARGMASRNRPFLAEWMLVSVVMLGMVGLNQLALTLAMLDRPPLGQALLRALFTAAVYPAAVLLSHYVMGVRAADPAEADALGRRL